ncbi:MAG: FecR family protein [Massilibacteroides sp.]|nr:FecR family protein [Massilibacteroides sp.]MDD3063568.1 FecR family protein [Massilibacteroides sp.]MDD4114241.1 FecR family protein [Massilibacteroides sp.]MDD4660993.1 FecR family protein [Massilibacteroides sp.]
MKDQYHKILKDGLKDEVSVNEEWEHLSSTIKEKDKQRNPKKKKTRFSLSFLKYAAAILAGFIVSSATFLCIKQEPDRNNIGNYKVHTEKGKQSFIELPDGSKIWLNACTTIEYAADYGIANRDIDLDGEAYFEVAKNKALPFVVKTKGINVKALGTAFNISAYPDDMKLVTTLFSGEVSVQPTLTKEEVLLQPNQILIYHKDIQQIEKKDSPDKKGVEWRNGILAFDMLQMNEITKMLERNYDIFFKYENERIKTLQFSGAFRNNESINDVLKIISTNTSIGYIINKDTIIFK